MAENKISQPFFEEDLSPQSYITGLDDAIKHVRKGDADKHYVKLRKIWSWVCGWAHGYNLARSADNLNRYTDKRQLGQTVDSANKNAKRLLSNECLVIDFDKGKGDGK